MVMDYLFLNVVLIAIFAASSIADDVGSTIGYEQVLLQRVKRAGNGPANLSAILDTNPSGITTMKVSDHLLFDYTISVPEGTHSLTASISTDIAGGENVFSLCGVYITATGSNLGSPSMANVTLMQITAGSQLAYNIDSADIDFGMLTNDGTVAGLSANSINVTFEAVVVNSTALTHGVTYNVNATATLDGGTQSWEEVRSFTAVHNGTLQSAISAMFNVTPPPHAIILGDMGIWTLTANLRDAVNKLRLEAWVDWNNITYPPCIINLAGTGLNYRCFTSGIGNITTINDKAVFEIPTLINADFRDTPTTSADDNIMFSIEAKTPFYADVTDAVYLNLEVFLDDVSVWSAQELISLTTGDLPVSSGYLDSLQIESAGNTTVINKGSCLTSTLTVSPGPSMITPYKVIVETNATIADISSIVLTSISNLCASDHLNVTFNSTDSTANMNRVEAVTDSMVDFGHPSRQFQLDVAVCVPPDSSALNGSLIGVSVNVMFEHNQSVSDMIYFTVNGTDEIPQYGMTNLTALLTPMDIWENTTGVIISNKIPINYTIIVPEGTHTLSSTINTTIVGSENVFSICSVYVTRIGTNLNVNSTIGITFLQNTGSQGMAYKMDSVDIDFGTVTSSNNATSVDESMIEVMFDVIVVNSSVYSVASVYYVEAKAVMNGGAQSWIDQVGFTAQDSSSLQSAVSATFNVTPPAQPVIVADFGTWTLTANLRDAVNKLRLEAWVDRNNYTYAPCNVNLTSIGFNYGCLTNGSGSLTVINDRAVYEIPTLINAEFNDIPATNADDDVMFSIEAKTPFYADITDVVYLNLEVFLDDVLVWSAQEQMSLTTGELPVSNGYLDSLTVESVGNTTAINKGSCVTSTISVAPGPSMITSYTVAVETNATIANISSITLTSITNMCASDYLNVTFFSTDSTTNMNRVEAITDSMADLDYPTRQFQLDVSVCVPLDSSALNGSLIGVSVNVVFEHNQSVSDMIYFTVNGTDVIPQYGMTNLTALLTPMGTWENTTGVIISNKIPINYTIIVPEGTHTLSSTINTTIVSGENVFSICSVYVTRIGTNLNVNSTIGITFLQNTGSQGMAYKMDSVDIDFGTVTSSNNVTSVDESMIEVMFDVIVVNSSVYSASSVYYVEAKAVINGGAQSWIEQIGFTAQDSSNLQSAVSATFNVTPPAQPVIVGGFGTWTLNANLRDAVNKLRLEAWVDRNNYTYAPCNVNLTSLGFNYGCLTNGSGSLTVINDKAVYEIPTLINAEFSDIPATIADDDVIFSIEAKTPFYADITDSVYLNLDVFLDDVLVWSAQELMSLTTGDLPVSSGYLDSLQIESAGNTTVINKGSCVTSTISVVPGPSMLTSYTVAVETNATIANISSITLTSITNMCTTANLNVTFFSTDSTTNMNRVEAVTDSMADLNYPTRQFQLDVSVCVPSDSSALNGSLIGVSVNVVFEYNQSVSDMIYFTVDGTDEVPHYGMTNLTAYLTPMGAWENTTDVIISNKIPMNYTIIVPEGTHTLSSSINTTIVGGENVFSICSVEIARIGAKLSLNNSVGITYLHNAGSLGMAYKIDRVDIDFGTVMSEDNVTSVNESMIELTFDVIVVNSSVYSAASVYNVEAKVDMDGGAQSWIEQVGFTAQDSSNLWSAVPPVFNISGASQAVLGGVVNWTVSLNLRDAVNKVQLRAWVNGTVHYPACCAYLSQIGANYACLDSASAITTLSGDSLWYEIPTVINTGFNDNIMSLPADDVVLDVLTRVPSYLNTSANLTLNIEAYLDDKLAWSTAMPLSLVTGSLPLTNTVAWLQIGNFNNVTTVAKGSAIVVTIDVTTGLGSVTPYSVTVTTDAGLASIASVTVMSAGENVCMDGHLDTTFSSTDTSDVMNRAVAVTGSVVNTDMQGASNGTADQFRVEVVVCVAEDSPAVVGSSLGLTVDVLYEGSKTVSDSTVITVASTSDLALATGSANLTNSTSPSGNISDVVTVTQLVEFQQTTEWFNITVDVPVIGGSALATLVDVQKVFAGANFPCASYNVSETSRVVVSHSQTTQVTYALGYLVNTETAERSSFKDPMPTDNTIELELTLQILDHVMNTQNSFINVTTTLIGSSGFTTSAVSTVAVDITGVERPELVFDVSIEQFTAQKVSGDNVTFSINIYHATNSTAHAQDAVVHCMTPYYMEFVDMLTTQDANITVDDSFPQYGIKFQISEIDFNDNVSFTFTVVLDPGRVMPVGSVDLKNVVPVDLTYRGPVRADRVDTGTIHSDVAIFSFTFDTENVGPIGVASGLIQDCQITASSWLDSNTPADARLATGQGWKPGIRGAPFCGNEYIQVSLGVSSLLTGIRLQSSTDDYTDIPTSYTIMYSADGDNWLYVYGVDNVTPKNFTIDVTSGSSVNDVYDLELTPRLTSRYIRLVPRAARCLIGLRLELVGILGTGPAVNCSLLANTSSPSQLVERNYLVNPDTGTIFVCGPERVGGRVYCSRSGEAGDAWQAIDDAVSNVVGTVTNTSTVIGLSHDGVSHVISFDDGFTWEVISAAELTSYKTQAGYVAAVEFPDEDMRSQTFDSIYSVYGMDGDVFSLTGCVDGIAVKPTGGSWQTKAWWGTQEASTMV